MFVADSLAVIGLATLSLGTIHEADGSQEHTFWLRNAGQEAIALTQGYTSCGCTTIRFDQNRSVAPGDSTAVTLHFNPRGKGGEFHETGTIVYGPRKKLVNLTLTGTCVTSEETLLRQFPIRISDSLRLSTNRFDLGIMRRGETKERHVTLLHTDEDNRQESILIRFTPDPHLAKGLHHVSYPVTTKVKGRKQTFTITLDVMIK